MRLADCFRNVAQRLGCHFLDAGMLGLTMHPNDYMHLDAASHQKLADCLAKIIPGMLPCA